MHLAALAEERLLELLKVSNLTTDRLYLRIKLFELGDDRFVVDDVSVVAGVRFCSARARNPRGLIEDLEVAVAVDIRAHGLGPSRGKLCGSAEWVAGMVALMSDRWLES